MDEPAADEALNVRTLIVFRLSGRHYGVPVVDVVEVLRMVSVTSVPDAPEWVAGVIDLRGRTLPIVDLRTRLGLDHRPPDLDTMIVVVSRDGCLAGLIVDEAVEAITVPGDAIAPPDGLVGENHPLAGIMNTDERLVLVVDVARLIGGLDELRVPDAVASHV